MLVWGGADALSASFYLHGIDGFAAPSKEGLFTFQLGYSLTPLSRSTILAQDDKVLGLG